MRAAHAEYVHIFSDSFLYFKEAGQTTERRVSKMVGFVMDAIVIIRGADAVHDYNAQSGAWRRC